MDSTPPAHRGRTLAILALVAFIDMAGLSILFPLFPAMLEHYVAREPADGLLAATLARLATLTTTAPAPDGAAASTSIPVLVLFAGILGSLYSGLQLLTSPFWGALSDRHGRRRVILLTTLGTLAAHGLWVVAASFWVLVVARLVAGAFAGNISAASAAVSDLYPGRERARGMALLGIGIGLGFVLGPAIGGLASLVVLGQGGDGHLGLNPFSAAALAAALLAALNVALAARFLPETRAAAAGRDSPARPSLIDLGALGEPGTTRAALVSFAYLVAFSAMELTLTFLAVDRFGFSPGQNALIFLFVGGVMIAVQGGLVRRAVARLGERFVIALGIGATGLGLIIIGLAAQPSLLYAGLFSLALGNALVTPSINALFSRYVPDDRQGFAFGVLRSLGALARALSPFLGGVAYWRLGSAACYVATAIVLIVPLALTLSLPPPPASSDARA